jgi:hypothetical protein
VLSIVRTSPSRVSVLADDGLESRDLRDVLDRVLDKGIVVDLASRLHMMGDGPPDAGERFIVGSVETKF